MGDEQQTLAWHALNYRTAATQHAQGALVTLEAFVSGMIAQAVAAERERCAAFADGYPDASWPRSGMGKEIADEIRAGTA